MISKGLNLGLVVVALLATGCSQSIQANPKKNFATYRVATSKLAPEPTYSRLRWVFPPEPLPGKTAPDSELALDPVIEYSMQNSNLDQGAKALAAPFGYHSYCSSELAHKKLNLRMVGTLQEVAQTIEKTSGIKVVVDQVHREIRFLPIRPVEPRMLEEDPAKSVVESKVKNEYQSTN